MATPLTQIPLDQLKVTDGSVLEHEPGFLEVTDPAIRATVKHDRNSTASLQFRYLRRSDDVATAGSGAVFVQIGLELRALNPCNLVYVMWRIRPEELVVQVKRNPGQSTSAQCGNQGYTTISQMPYPEPEGGTLHELTAEVRELADRSADVRIWTDWELAMQAHIRPELLAGIVGPAGFRTDNGIFNFRFFVG